MINQQINLYQDRFRDIRPPLSALHAGVIVTTTLLVLVVSSLWYQGYEDDHRQRYEQSLQRQQEVTQKLEQQRSELQALLADDRLELQLQQVNRDIALRERMIDFVAGNQLGEGRGFAGNLDELSRMQVKDVWLSEIALAENQIRLAGSALNEEKVPQYFGQLQERELFEGRVFEVFQVDRTSQSDWKVDFVIASRAASHE